MNIMMIILLVIYIKEWDKLIKENGEMRIIENAEIKSVPYSYYDEEIKEIVKNSGEVKMGDLVEKLIEKHIGSDMEYTYLIQRLIEKQELVIVKQGERFYSSLIGIK